MTYILNEHIYILQALDALLSHSIFFQEQRQRVPQKYHPAYDSNEPCMLDIPASRQKEEHRLNL